MKLIKINEDHYVIVDDSPIEVGDFVAEKLLIALFALGRSSNVRKYTVLVTFCDGREPREVVVTGVHAPTSSDIRNNSRELAVTEWNGYLNVCELKTIKIENL